MQKVRLMICREFRWEYQFREKSSKDQGGGWCAQRLRQQVGVRIPICLFFWVGRYSRSATSLGVCASCWLLLSSFLFPPVGVGGGS